MNESYLTIRKDGKSEIEIKKSRFICSLKRVENEEEALAFIREVKQEHQKATHNCSAYLIGEQDAIQRAHDDGEPSGTAGIPMLEVLKKKELKNVAAVVTRYFGGIKLGAGGLIRAYGKAVTQTLDQVGLVKTIPHVAVSIRIDYTLSGSLENNMREANYDISTIDYTDQVTYHCQIDINQLAVFYDEVTEWTNGKAVFKKGGINYIDRPVQG